MFDPHRYFSMVLRRVRTVNVLAVKEKLIAFNTAAKIFLEIRLPFSSCQAVTDACTDIQLDRNKQINRTTTRQAVTEKSTDPQLKSRPAIRQ